jgi:glycosyltransferase involved in cell wall biosynthesis
MRIGIDARSLGQKGLGVGRYLSNLLKHYPELDRSNEYLLYLKEGKPSAALSGFSSKTISLPLLNYNFAWLNLRLPFELVRDRIDLFHCPFYGLPVYQPCPMIVTIHDIIYEIHPEWFPKLRGASFRFLSRWGAKTARKIIAVSEHTKKDIIERYHVPEERIEVIYEAPDDMYKPVKDEALLRKTKLKYNITKDFLIHVGAIHKRRNIISLLKVFKRLRQGGRDLQLVLVGSIQWPFIDLKRLLVDMGLRDDVGHLGFVPDEDLVCLYNAAMIFVYPSLYEGFGLPLVEAMACGTPVAASNVSSIPEVVGDAGILFDPYNEDEIFDSIKGVLDDKNARDALVSKGLSRAKQFSWVRAAKQTIELYNNAVSKGR